MSRAAGLNQAPEAFMGQSRVPAALRKENPQNAPERLKPSKGRTQIGKHLP
jgi:hypothetical protein